MKKKSLLFSGLMSLGAVACITTAFAVSLSSPAVSVQAEEDEDDIPVSYVNPKNYSPAAGTEIGSNVGVSEIYAEFSVGDSGLECFYADPAAVVTIKRDGETVESYPFELGSKNVYVPTTGYNGRLYIKPTTPLKEPGVYTVEIPEGLVGSTSFGEGGASKNINNALQWSFTILPALDYVTSPAAGGDASLSQMAHFTFTYPEGTTITASTLDSKAPYLTHFVNGVTKTETTYSVSIEGNVVTFNANDPAAITVATKAINLEYANLVIPAGLLTISNGDLNYQNAETVVGPYHPIAISAGDITFIPALDTPGLKITDLEEVTMVLAEGVEFVKAGSAITANDVAFTIYPDITNTAWYFQFGYTSIDADKRTAKLYLKKGTSTTATANNWDLCQAGPTTVQIKANVLQTADGKKNALINMKGYDLEGIEYAPIYSSTPQFNGVVTSITGLTLSFPVLTKVVDENAEITLSLDGKVVASCKAGDTTTAAAKAAGSKSIAFANLFKNNGVAFNQAGEYVYHIPAGAFQQVGRGNYLNKETEITVYIARNYAGVEYTPAPATFSGTSTALVATPAPGNEDMTELESLTVTYPEGTVITLTEGYENKLSNGGAILSAASGALNNTQESYTTVASGYTIKTATVDGNKVTLTLAKPYRVATRKNYAPGFKVPAGVFIAKIPNGDGGYDLYPNAAFCTYYQPFPMNKGTLSSYELNTNGSADIQPLPSDAAFLLSTQLQTIIYSAYEPIYTTKTKPTAVLTSEGGTVIAEYTGASPDEVAGLNTSNVIFTTDTDLSNLDRGIYKFIIDKETLVAGNELITNAAAVTNLVDFEYELNVLNLKITESPAQGEVVGELSKIYVDYNDVMVAKVNSSLKPLVYVKEKIEEGIYAGDYQDVDVTTLGYQVDFKVNGMVVPEDFDFEDYSLRTMSDDVDPGYGQSNIQAEITITPALTEERTYYVHIPAGLISLETVCKSPTLDLEYTVVPAVAFEEAVQLFLPATNEVELKQTYGGMYGMPFGMAAIELSVGKNVSVDTKSSAKVQLLYNGAVIAEVGTGTPGDDGTGIHDTTPNIFADGDGVIDWNESKRYLIMFDSQASDKFKQPGEYSLVIPQGVFVTETLPVMAGQINYVLLADAVKEDGYSVSPEEGSLFGLEGLPAITLTIENVSMLVDYEKNPAKLYGPDGELLKWASNYPTVKQPQQTKNGTATLTWTPSSAIEWTKGTYSVVISANTIAIDAWADEVDPTFPSKDIVVTYIVDDPSSVAIVGLEGADSYTVYTLDGKVVLLNAPAEKLVDLSSGLYIINGKKVKVVK